MGKKIKKNNNEENNDKRKKIYTPEQTLNFFNSHYDSSVCWDDESITVDGGTKGPGKFIAKDISRLTLPRCRELVIRIPQSQLRFFRPKMPALERLRINESGIEYINLPKAIFNGLTEINLDGNRIKSAEAIAPLKELASLQKLSLIGNPIANNEQEKMKLLDLFPFASIITN